MSELKFETINASKINPFLIGLSKIPEVVENLIVDYQRDLEEAWSNVGDSDFLTISFSVKMGLDEGKGISDIEIKFTKEKVKGSRRIEWEQKQMSLIK